MNLTTLFIWAAVEFLGEPVPPPAPANAEFVFFVDDGSYGYDLANGDWLPGGCLAGWQCND